MRKTKTPELLAPAGDWVSLDAALDAGADALYFGVDGLNMRAGAKNFRTRDLRKIAEKCHAKGVRAYLTLNVVVFEKELGLIDRLLKAAKKAGVDAVIGADMAVLAAARKAKMAVHASTQMSAANSAALALLHELGVNRFVLARECSLDDIKRIKIALKKALGRDAAGVEIEAFVHGAMCVSMSGRCFLSNFETGRSANRGECTQPCRREYRVVEEGGGSEWVVGKNYVLSPADLCTLPFLDKLVAAGVDSCKIEGRNRSPEYVATVVGAYRKALDFIAAKSGTKDFAQGWVALKDELMGELGKVYHREFSSGFYFGKPIGEWCVEPHSVAPLRKCFVGVVVNYYKRPGVAEVAVQDEGIRIGDEIVIEGVTTGFFQQKVESLQVEAQAVNEGSRGSSVGLKLKEVVRRGDKIYVMRPRVSSAPSAR